MPATPWYRRPIDVQTRQQDQILKRWVTHEVAPFSRFWSERLRGVVVVDVDSLEVVPVATEAVLAGAGGAGNPALLLSPTEDGFKTHASRRDLLTAARRAGSRGAVGRRHVIWHRYKPVHVHEAGVDRLIAVAYTRADLDLLHLAGARLAEVMGWGGEDALVNLVPSGPSVRFWGLYHAALANRMTALHPRTAGQSAVSVARRALALLPATLLAVPVEEAEAVLDGLLAAGTRAANLRMVVPVGAPPGAAMRIRLAELATRLAGGPVRVQAVWAPELSRVLYGEAPVAAGDPPEATYGLLTYPDLELLQVRDVDTGSLVGDGRPGELVITSLGWRGTALMRVATGSWVAGLEQAAPHPVTGATVPRIAPSVADGAWQPRVSTDAGLRRPDLRGAARLIAPVAESLGRVDWSLGMHDDRLRLTIDAPASTDPAVLEALISRVAAGVGVRPDLQTGPVPVGRHRAVGAAPPPGSDR